MKHTILTDIKELESIISSIRVCYVSFVDGDKPYVLPYNFGYSDNTIFIHGNGIGRKDQILISNNNVCIAFSKDEVLHYVNEEVACSYSMKFKSVIAKGKAHKIEDFDEKIEALNVIMNQYVDREFTYNEPAIKDITIYRIEIEEMTGRKRG